MSQVAILRTLLIFLFLFPLPGDCGIHGGGARNLRFGRAMHSYLGGREGDGRGRSGMACETRGRRGAICGREGESGYGERERKGEREREREIERGQYTFIIRREKESRHSTKFGSHAEP